MAATDKLLTEVGAHLAQATREKDTRGMHNNRRIASYNILYATMGYEIKKLILKRSYLLYEVKIRRIDGSHKALLF